MEISPLDIRDVKILRPKKHGDARGFFSETWNRAALEAAGIDIDFVQDNQSLSAARGTVRGLHFQTPPHAQTKLLRVIRGAVFDVAVDLRRGSPDYGRHASAVISAEAWNQILVPVGFAHGFMTLEPDTEVIYKVSGIYSPAERRRHPLERSRSRHRLAAGRGAGPVRQGPRPAAPARFRHAFHLRGLIP